MSVSQHFTKPARVMRPWLVGVENCEWAKEVGYRRVEQGLSHFNLVRFAHSVPK